MENFKKTAVTFFPQQIQTDKIHHQKAWKISYQVVYLVHLHNLFPGSAIFGLLSTGLLAEQATSCHHYLFFEFDAFKYSKPIIKSHLGSEKASPRNIVNCKRDKIRNILPC